MRTTARVSGASMVLGLLGVAGCAESEKPPFTVALAFDAFSVVSTTPLKAASDGAFLPACGVGDTVVGFRMHFNLRTAEHTGSLYGNEDRQLRIGDWLEDGTRVAVGPGEVLSHASFQFGSEGDALDSAAPLNPFIPGILLPKVTPTNLVFQERTTSREKPVAIALLVDHSRSFIGFYEPQYFYETKSFVSQGQEPLDPKRSRYHALGESIVSRLNRQDRVIAWFFNEEGVHLACTRPEIENFVEGREKACFACEDDDCRKNQGWVYDIPAETGAFHWLINIVGTIAGVAPHESGRTPLWAAVKQARSFLASEAKDMAKHIVVITDSPDTCHPSSPWFVPDEPCSTVSYDEVRSAVLETPENKRIPVSIIQIASKGYPEPDGAQMEIACLTGGTYQFVDPNESVSLDTALTERSRKIRDTFGGVWELDVEMSALHGLIPPGHVIALHGPVTANGPLFSATGTASQIMHALVRTTCVDDASCGSSGDDCLVHCIPEGNICAIPGREPWVSTGSCCCGVSVGPDTECNALREPCCTVPEDSSSPGANFQCALIPNN